TPSPEKITLFEALQARYCDTMHPRAFHPDQYAAARAQYPVEGSPCLLDTRAQARNELYAIPGRRRLAATSRLPLPKQNPPPQPTQSLIRAAPRYCPIPPLDGLATFLSADPCGRRTRVGTPEPASLQPVGSAPPRPVREAQDRG